MRAADTLDFAYVTCVVCEGPLIDIWHKAQHSHAGYPDGRLWLAQARRQLGSDEGHARRP
jgi:hypothetical protein